MRATSTAIILLLSLIGETSSWSVPSSLAFEKASSANKESTWNKLNEIQSRRDWVQQVSSVGVTAGIALFAPLPASAVSTTTTGVLIDELNNSKSKLQEIPQLLQDQEWDKVRTILKTPPVNKLWNLGDSQNTVMTLAKETGNVELFEMKDDLAYSLQMCDQFTYDNVFVYFQPGNGKIKIKEPTDAIQKAMSQIQQIIDEN